MTHFRRNPPAARRCRPVPRNPFLPSAAELARWRAVLTARRGFLVGSPDYLRLMRRDGAWRGGLDVTAATDAQVAWSWIRQTAQAQGGGGEEGALVRRLLDGAADDQLAAVLADRQDRAARRQARAGRRETRELRRGRPAPAQAAARRITEASTGSSATG